MPDPIMLSTILTQIKGKPLVGSGFGPEIGRKRRRASVTVTG
jgi:hypothetical protein